MRRLFVAIVLFSLSVCLWSQTSPAPQRTAEEEARKQTGMMVRELGLTDSLQMDTLYRLHLKYARLRRESNTRQEELNRLVLFTGELKQILTAEQYTRFMNAQVDSLPRHRQPFYGRRPPRDSDKPTTPSRRQ